MIRVLPEPKKTVTHKGYTKHFSSIYLHFNEDNTNVDWYNELAKKRFWNRQDVVFSSKPQIDSITIEVIPSLKGLYSDNAPLFQKQGYHLEISSDNIILRYEEKSGYLYGLTTIKQLLIRKGEGYFLPCGKITDWPTVEKRAVATTFSWYAGYGRIGFDMQLWGYKEWVEYLNICIDHKINQMNMVMYGYWPFQFDAYPETTFSNVPVKIWNAENNRWLTIRYSHPNIEDDYLEDFISLAHEFDFSVFAYVGLNSYNGAYSIKRPEKRMLPPKDCGFLNDFDSLCLSDEENVEYILSSMKKIAALGFDGYTLEESEEGFWFCGCAKCTERWHKTTETPGEAKHKANTWLLGRIYNEVRSINSEIVIGIRAFRQPPLEKDESFLREQVENLPDDIMLFWAPGLYVPESEFTKWVSVFGKERIWGRDTESNSITSTMGRLYRTFESNVLRYEDETNVQIIERDIEQHIGSANHGVKGINGYMFEWYGLFMHHWAHGNYGWGSKMNQDEFFELSCELAFGKDLGGRVLFVLKNILTIHQSQMPFYTTPFPFQKNKIMVSDIPAIRQAQVKHPGLLIMIHEIQKEVESTPDLHIYIPHFQKIENAQRRNAVIYDMALASLDYEGAITTDEKEIALDKILEYNEKDFAIAKKLFFDINPVSESGVKSCMFPYHEIKRLIYNLRNPEKKDNEIICSGIEALGWLWL